MDFLFISMPYARFISRWFANVPNINLGIMQSYLGGKGKRVKTFHFHLEFLPYLEGLPPHIRECLFTLTEQYGVEYMGLDYVFASLFFEDKYRKSRGRFKERLESLGVSLHQFEELRGVAQSFVDSCFAKLSPYLKDARLVGFSCSHYQLSGSLLLCSRIKQAYPGIPTVFGGKDCTGAFSDDLMRELDIVDFTGTSECEITVGSILDHLENPGSALCNVVYRDANGRLLRSPTQPNIPINSLPFPRYDFDAFPLRKSDIILPIEFGRGCPWKRCSFCPDESYNILCQAKSAEQITAEIASYQSISPDLKNFFILDSDALKDPRTIIEVAEKISGMGLNFIYAEFRAEKMDRQVLRALKQFGTWVTHFQIGIEAFSDGMLRRMHKGVTVLKNVEVLKAAADLGISVQFNLFTCFPGMTEKDFQENMRVMDLITHILLKDNFSIFPGEFYLPPDSPVFLDPDKFALIKSNESIFASIFEDFGMPSFSNYPYPYRFQNDEAQYQFAAALHAKVNEIKSKSAADTYMNWKSSPEGLEIEISQNGRRWNHLLGPEESAIYLSAIEKSQEVDAAASNLGIPLSDMSSILRDFQQKGIILLSPDERCFLSLALEKSGSQDIIDSDGKIC